MTGSSEISMESVAKEVNQMDVELGKNFKILDPNDQIRGKIKNFNCEHIFKKISNRIADNFKR